MRSLLIIAAVVAGLTACKKEDKGAPAATPPTAEAGSGAAKPTEVAPGGTTTTTTTTTTPGSGAAMAPDNSAPPPPVPPPPSTTPGPRPASITDAQVATADQLVAVMQDLGKAVDAAKGDCKAAGRAITASAAKIKPIAEEADKIKAMTENDPAAKQWFQTTYVPKMMSAYGPLMSIGQKCQGDKDFMAAMESMPVGKKRKVDAPAPAPAP